MKPTKIDAPQKKASNKKRRNAPGEGVWKAVSYAVRRFASRPGHFQQEQLGTGDWQPVGSLAAERLRETHVDVSRLLMESDKAIHKLNPEFHSRVAGEAVRLADRKNYSTPEAAWLAILQGKVHGKGIPMQVVGTALGTLSTPWVNWIPFDISLSSREFRLNFSLQKQPETGALALSCSFGLLSNRLWICRRCRRPFVRQHSRPRQNTCDGCGRARAVTTAAGLSQEVGELYARLRKRLDLRVHRKSLRPEECDRLKRAALRDARLVGPGRPLTLEVWKTRHDQKERPGRKPATESARVPRPPALRHAQQGGEESFA